MSIYKEFVSSFLPKDILTYFDLIDFKKEGNQLRVYLTEKIDTPIEHQNEHIQANGFLNEINVKDFPIRDLFVVLHIKRRRWLLVDNNKKVTRNWDLIATGTRLTSEFSAFLKELA